MNIASVGIDLGKKAIYRIYPVCHGRGRCYLSSGSNNMTLGWFIAGVGVGATASLLIKPASGVQMCEAISDAASAAVEVDGEKLEDVKDQAQGVVEDAKKAAQAAEVASAQVRTSADLHSEAS
jgi:gas vesicle protein